MPGPGRMGGGPRRGGFGGPRRGPGGFGHRPPMHRPPMFHHRPPMHHYHHRPYGYGCMGCCLYLIGGAIAVVGAVAALLSVVL